jgi:hypothetical protein
MWAQNDFRSQTQKKSLIRRRLATGYHIAAIRTRCGVYRVSICDAACSLEALEVRE